MTDPSIEARLDRLESQNRILRFAVCGLVLVVATLQMLPGPSEAKDPPSNTLTLHKLIVDEIQAKRIDTVSLSLQDGVPGKDEVLSQVTLSPDSITFSHSTRSWNPFTTKTEYFENKTELGPMGLSIRDQYQSVNLEAWGLEVALTSPVEAEKVRKLRRTANAEAVAKYLHSSEHKKFVSELTVIHREITCRMSGKLRFRLPKE